MAKTEAIPVKVNRAVYDRVKHYSATTKVPAAQVITEAITDWLETTGEARLEALTRKTNVVAIDTLNVN